MCACVCVQYDARGAKGADASDDEQESGGGGGGKGEGGASAGGKVPKGGPKEETYYDAGGLSYQLSHIHTHTRARAHTLSHTHTDSITCAWLLHVGMCTDVMRTRYCMCQVRGVQL